MNIVGIDIGGANIKAADTTGRATSRPFAIWRHPERLVDELASILHTFPKFDRIALTMTAELADCFSTKAHGVTFILEAVEQAVLRHDSADTTILAWSTDSRFLTPDEARQTPVKVAAANWNALATWCGQMIPHGAGLMIDIGTTTTDIIPLMHGRPVAIGATDVGRLLNGELSYCGVRRTPLCAVSATVPFANGVCPLAAELFATTLDVYLLLNLIPEDELNLETANGKPATKSAAYDRVVRMLCCDRDEVSCEDAVKIAQHLADVQQQKLAECLARVTLRLDSEIQSVIVSGSGSFLARKVVEGDSRTRHARIIALSDQLSPAISDAGCAYAIAQLALTSE